MNEPGATLAQRRASADATRTHVRDPRVVAVPSRTLCGLMSIYEARYVVGAAEYAARGAPSTPPAPMCEACLREADRLARP